ncbi:hypothetical protein [Natrialbaceae archaeon AArc-T1-2]|uniref:hypothetical protein n=1 Tax=Natrialbaceae archaeon AArc-T1-2 TaxID=3053904 RepID=UPI00255AEA0F|nr:hypothetical protein [Natrialbaceae archaeon AArc-T1-2]WIV67686.1 hypothetical protein QQ977_02845 [Natrialbaceae archaeon AArc-T1-2]
MKPTRGTLAKGIAVGAGVFLLFGIVSGLVPNPLYVRMVPRTPLDYAFLALTSVLAAVYVIQRSSLDSEECSGDRCAYAGTAGGFLAVACPTCNAVLLALFSSSALMTYFDPLRPLFGVVAVGLFGAIIYRRHRR